MCEKLEKLCQSWQAWRMNREPSLGLVIIPGCRQPTFFSKEANFAFREADLQLRGERGEEEPQLRRLAEALQPGEGLVEHLGRGPAF